MLIRQVESVLTYFFILLQGHRGLPGEAGDQGRQGNWVKYIYYMSLSHANIDPCFG